MEEEEEGEMEKVEWRWYVRVDEIGELEKRRRRVGGDSGDGKEQ